MKPLPPITPWTGRLLVLLVALAAAPLHAQCGPICGDCNGDGVLSIVDAPFWRAGVSHPFPVPSGPRDTGSGASACIHVLRSPCL